MRWVSGVDVHRRGKRFRKFDRGALCWIAALTVAGCDGTFGDDGQVTIANDGPVVVDDAPSSDASVGGPALTSLRLSAGQMTFDPSTFDYEVNVGLAAQSIALTPSPIWRA